MKYVCSECVYYDELHGKTEYGECRRKSPIHIGKIDNEAIWPLVNENDGCGDHKLLPGEACYQCGEETFSNDLMYDSRLKRRICSSCKEDLDG